MKLTGRQAMLIAQDIFKNLKVKEGTLSPAQENLIKGGEKALKDLNKKTEELRIQLDLLEKDRQKVMTSINSGLDTNVSSYYATKTDDVVKYWKNAIKNRNKPTLQGIADRVEIAAMKTEHKDLDKFIAEIAKEFK